MDTISEPTHASEAINAFLAGEPLPPTVHIDMDEAAAKYLRESKIATALERWNDACPDLLKHSDFTRPDLGDVAAQIREILAWEYQDQGLFITGPTGRAKSRAAWALLRKLAEQGREIRYFTASEWFSELQAQVRFGRDEAGSWVKALSKTPLVFIDDLGQEAVASAKQDWAQGWFFQFLDQRMGNSRPLIITSNLSAREIAGQQVGTAAEVRANPLVRRLTQMCRIVKF